MGVNSLPKTVTRQRRDYDLNPGPSAPESSTLTTRLPSHSRATTGYNPLTAQATFTRYAANAGCSNLVGKKLDKNLVNRTRASKFRDNFV